MRIDLEKTASGVLLAGFFVFVSAMVVTAHAQTARSQGGTVEAKFIGDHIVIPVTLRTQLYEKQHHLLIDLGAQESFAIDANLYGGIGFGEGETTLKALNEGFHLEFPRREVVPFPSGSPPIAAAGLLTERYDIELENVDVLAVVGYRFLRHYRMRFDPEAGRLTMAPAAPNT